MVRSKKKKKKVEEEENTGILILVLLLEFLRCIGRLLGRVSLHFLLFHWGGGGEGEGREEEDDGEKEGEGRWGRGDREQIPEEKDATAPHDDEEKSKLETRRTTAKLHAKHDKQSCKQSSLIKPQNYYLKCDII